MESTHLFLINNQRDAKSPILPQNKLIFCTTQKNKAKENQSAKVLPPCFNNEAASYATKRSQIPLGLPPHPSLFPILSTLAVWEQTKTKKKSYDARKVLKYIFTKKHDI